MHFSTLATVLLAALATASPTPTKTLQKRSFKHYVKRNIDRRSPDAGARAMLKAYRKFGFPIIGRQMNTTTPQAGAQGGKVAALPEQNLAEYLSPVSIGGQTVNLDFDTGSSDL